MEKNDLSQYRNERVGALEIILKEEIDVLRRNLRKALQADFDKRAIAFEAEVKKNIAEAIEEYDRDSKELEKKKHLPSYARAALSLQRSLEAAIESQKKLLAAFTQMIKNLQI